MQFSTVTRTDLAVVLGGPKVLREKFYASDSRPPSPPVRSEVVVCWNENDEIVAEDFLPNMLIVGDEDLSDFLAWATTFLSAYRPLSAFIRVIPWSLFSSIEKVNGEPRIRDSSLLIGAILGETFTNGTGRGFIETLPMSAFESTCSFAMSRALTLGFEDSTLNFIMDAWNLTRDLGGQKARRLASESLEGVWRVIPYLLSKRRSEPYFLFPDSDVASIIEACEELRRRGSISEYQWARLAGNRIETRFLNEAMKSTREKRVEIFETIVHRLARSGKGTLSINFLVGYLASLIGDGSFEHAHLIFPLQNELPSAMLWYGVCSALSKTDHVFGDYSHLGLRISRLINRRDDLKAGPQCDISLAELEIMSRGETRGRHFRQAQNSVLRVELAPGVTTVIRSINSHGEQQNIFGDDGKAAGVDVEKLRQIIKNLQTSLSLSEAMLNAKPERGDVTPKNKRPRRS